MKKRSLFWSRRALSLLLVLLLAAGLLPGGLMPAWTPAARAAEEDIPALEYDDEIRIITVGHPYMEVGKQLQNVYYERKDYYGSYYDLLPFSDGHYVEPDRDASESGYSIDLIEKETGRLVDISKTSQEKLEYKAYTLRVYAKSGRDGQVNKEYLKFAEDIKVYLSQHSDAGVTENYTYIPASHVYFLDEERYRICAEFDLDYTYFNSFHFEKTVLGEHGVAGALNFGVAWYNKDDVLGDGHVSYDPDTGTLHLKGDVDRFWLRRWPGEEPPRISVDDDVNVDQMILSAADGDRLIIEGSGTLNVGTIDNHHKKIVISGCNAYFKNWETFSLVRLENAVLTSPEGAWLNTAGQVLDENGNQVEENVAFRRSFTNNEDSGDAGTIHWHYDFVTKTFSVSGSGKFERLAPYDKYLDVMEVFRTEAGVTELGDNIVRDSVRLRKVFLVNTIKRVGRNNFAGCKNLTEVNIPIGLEYIMSGCFSGSGMKAVSIPRTLLLIDDGCFSNMPNLETITFPYENKASYLVVGDGCFAHLPQAREIKFGDGPWIIGAGSFCDMPQLIKIRQSKQADSITGDVARIYLGNSLRYIGDYSFSDLPKVNYTGKRGLNIDERQGLVHQYYHLSYTIREIGRGSLGYVNGTVSGWHIDFEPPPNGSRLPVHLAARYGYANRLTMILRLVEKGVPPSSEYKMGVISYVWDSDIPGENDVEALEDYLNRPLKAIGPGAREVWTGDRSLGSDIDFSGKVDHKDLILLKRRVAGWPGLDKYFDRDYLLEELESRPAYEVYREACEANYTAETGLELTVGSATVDYEDRAIVRVPVSSLSNAGYIGGSVTAKWDPEAMELIDVEYNDSLAPNNGTGPIDNELRYTLTKAEGNEEPLVLDYAGEHVIRFGDDFRTSDIKGTGRLFTLVFRLREGAKPSAYSATKTLDFEVALKGFDIYDAGLNFVRAEMTRAGTVTVKLGETDIREIDVGAIVMPFAGQNPSYTAVLPAGVRYKLLDDLDLAPLGSVFWVDTTDGGKQLVKQSDAFLLGHTYMVGISLVPTSDAFAFVPAAELRGTLNGMWDAEIWIADDGSEAMLTYTFTCEDGLPVTGLVLNKTGLTLEAGDGASLEVVAHVPYEAIDLGVAWSSSDPDVASVDPNGLVTALRAGSAVITATSVNGGVQATCAVTVEKRQHTILTVGAESIIPPAEGMKPVFSARVPAGGNYRLSDSSIFGGGVVWLRKNGDTYNLVEANESFRGGVTYRVWVYVEPEDTDADCYRFPAAEEMTAVVNGQSANVQWVSDDGTQACLEFFWTASLPWTFDPETEILTTGSAVSSACPVIVASYDAKGRFLGSAFVTAAGETGGVVKSGAKSISVFWLDRDTGRPIYAVEKIELG